MADDGNTPLAIFDSLYKATTVLKYIRGDELTDEDSKTARDLLKSMDAETEENHPISHALITKGAI